jgi:hypothetical protein
MAGMSTGKLTETESVISPPPHEILTFMLVSIVQRLYIFLGIKSELLQRLFLEGNSTPIDYKLFLRKIAKFYRDCSWKEDGTIMIVSGK